MYSYVKENGGKIREIIFFFKMKKIPSYFLLSHIFFFWFQFKG